MKKGIMFIVIAACCLLLTGGQPTFGKELAVGLMSTLSGPAGFLGKAHQAGVEFAVEDINAKGGLTVAGQNYKVKVVERDDKYTSTGGASAAEFLANRKGVKYILGPISSAAGLAAKPITEPAGVLILAACTTPKLLQEPAAHTFRGFVAAISNLPVFVPWFSKNFPDVKTMAFLEPNDETGYAVVDTMSGMWKGAGGKIAAVAYYDRGTQDFTPAITKMMAKNPDAIFPMTAPSQHTIVKQARELGYKGMLMGWGGDPRLIVKVAGEKAANGYTMYFAPGDPYGTTAPEGERALMKRYLEKYGKDSPLTFYLEGYYDITMGLFKAMQAAGTVEDTAAVAKALSNLRWKAVAGMDCYFGGEKTYGVKHDIVRPFYATQIKDGKVVTLKVLISEEKP